MRATTDRGTKFTIDDYLKLPEGYPVELIEGGFVREPQPTEWHQRIVGEMYVRLRAVAGSARVLPAPVDVRVDRWNALQPDVVAFGPEKHVGRRSPSGTIPVLAVEVLSPSTRRRDRARKTPIYLRAGVAEVWLVDPDAGTIEIRERAADDTEAVRRFAADEVAESRAIPGFRTSWKDLAGDE